jgi:selenocysteine lyase/cysteine desulfurase
MSTNMTQMNHEYGDNRAATTQPARQPQVAEAFDVLEKSVAAHEELCAALENRLQSVLRSEPEITEAGQSDPKRTVVEIAARINGSSDRLHQAANALNSILRRLEL